MFSTPKSHGYREVQPLDSNNVPQEALRGPNPQLHSANMDEFTEGASKANLGPMLAGIPEGTKRQIGM